MELIDRVKKILVTAGVLPKRDAGNTTPRLSSVADTEIDDAEFMSTAEQEQQQPATEQSQEQPAQEQTQQPTAEQTATEQTQQQQAAEQQQQAEQKQEQPTPIGAEQQNNEAVFQPKTKKVIFRYKTQDGRSLSLPLTSQGGFYVRPDGTVDWERTRFEHPVYWKPSTGIELFAPFYHDHLDQMLDADCVTVARHNADLRAEQQRAEQEAAAKAQAEAQAKQQQQAIAEQQAAQQPRYPTKKDGTPDYDKMTPQQEYDYQVETQGEESAQKVAQAYVNRYQSAVDNIQAQLDSGKGTNSVSAMQAKLNENKERLEAWRAFVKEQQQEAQPQTEQTQQTEQAQQAPQARQEQEQSRQQTEQQDEYSEISDEDVDATVDDILQQIQRQKELAAKPVSHINEKAVAKRKAAKQEIERLQQLYEHWSGIKQRRAEQKQAPQAEQQEAPQAEPVQQPQPAPAAQAEPTPTPAPQADPKAMSERFKNPRALFYASMMRKLRNAIQCADTSTKRQQLETTLKCRMKWWTSSIYNSICDPTLSAEYASVFKTLETEELTDAERRLTEMRAANLRMLHQQEQGEMYRYAMNLLRKAKEFSELERLVAETVIDTVENLRKRRLEMLVMPRLQKIKGVSDITINSGISVRPSAQGELMELIHVVEATVTSDAQADFLYAIETAADLITPDRFSIYADELIAKTHNNRETWRKVRFDPQFTELRYGMDDGVTVRFMFERETKNTLRFKELVDDEFDIPKMNTIYVNKSLLKKIGYSPLDTLYITLQHNGDFAAK